MFQGHFWGYAERISVIFFPFQPSPIDKCYIYATFVVLLINNLQRVTFVIRLGRFVIVLDWGICLYLRHQIFSMESNDSYLSVEKLHNRYEMREIISYCRRACLVFGLTTLLSVGLSAADNKVEITHLGDGQSIVRLDTDSRYLLLPVEESSPESKLYMIVDNDVVRTLNVRLSVNKVDYYVPVDLSGYTDQSVLFNFQQTPDSALCWKEMRLSDQFDMSNREKFRPTYHFTPAYGWMNDPNGMVYKDGEYHLFYQYNPYGSMWGNMHWGHAVSKDLLRWEHQPVAIAPDALGTIFSGSCVVDADNTAGFGPGAIVAFYTSASDRQTQSLAYSLDNGRTFKKYDRNPILTSTQRDFRDPKVFWHADTKKWIMILAVGQEMQLYSSANLKDWTFESRFGEGQGAHGGVWECPDLIELPVKGADLKKWVLICNINPGGPFGGSATQYFVGTFDGRQFVNEASALTKWMDWGKDHYATVTWSNAPRGRAIGIAWMSNWEYANNVPTMQYRSANSVPRELELYTRNGQTYVSSKPVPELLALRGKAQGKGPFKVDRPYEINPILADNAGAYEIEIKFKNAGADVIGFQLFNTKGEEVEMYYNLLENTFTMDRRKSGKVDFNQLFATATTAPVPGGKEYTLRLFVDKSSIEAFDGNGDFVLTNLVFPDEPYNRIRFYAKGGGYTVTSFTVYPLGI